MSFLLNVFFRGIICLGHRGSLLVGFHFRVSLGQVIGGVESYLPIRRASENSGSNLYRMGG